MVLNNHSIVHTKIRKSCQILEELTGMALITNLSEEFEEIRFVNKLSYIAIDYKNYACFSMSHHITEQEIKLIDDLMVYLNWIETGNKWRIKLARKNRKHK